MIDRWIEGEPTEAGYKLVLVRYQGNPEGSPWMFLANVILDKEVAHGRPIYMDHFSGDDCWRKYTGGHVVAHCEPTPENFAAAFAEMKAFYDEKAIVSEQRGLE
jgi:hypothetical protein